MLGLRIPSWIALLVWTSMGFAQALPSAPATSQTVSAPPSKPFDISGYSDFYYQIDFGKPPAIEPVNGRWYDVDHDRYSLAALQVDISRTPTAPHPFGFWVSLLAGPNASILASTEPAGINKYKGAAQAYITYLLPVKAPTTIDLGKWYAFVGYEGLDSRTQDNYSRSFTFTAMEPDYMTGFRVTSILNPKLTLNGYLYQGYNEIKNSNSTIMTGLGGTYSATDKLTLTLQGYEGKESDDVMNQSGSYGGIGFPTPGPSWVNQANPVIVYRPNTRDKFAFDGTYASAKGKGHWNGEALYYRRQFDNRNDACLRIERSEDTDGIRFLSGPLLLHSFTGTYDYAPNRYFLFRFELRHDIANLPFFNSDNGPAKQRTTLTFAQIFQF